MLAYAHYFHDARIKAYVSTLRQRGGDVDVIVLRPDDACGFEKDGNIAISYLSRKYQGASAFLYVVSYFVFIVRAFITLTVRSARVRYDAIHVHNMPNALVFAALVPKLLGSRVILDVHDLMPVNYMVKFHIDQGHLLIRCLILEQRLSALMACHVLCADHMQKEYLETVCGIPADKITVMLNVPNEQLMRPVPTPAAGDTFKLIYHGTIAKRLGIDIMLQAMSRIDSRIPVHLSIYGTGDFMTESLALASTLGLDDRVHFSKAFFPVEMIPEMVAGMDLGVVANRQNAACDRFMLPVKLLEYVYLKIPVVAPRLQIIKRYFGEDMVKYYEPENVEDLARCIVELYQAPDERARLVKNASRFYDDHNWQKQSAEYLDLLSLAPSTVS